eukprot:TRINITY_DN10530_c0_g1_i1.p1 TRINITY_DN10530_c0_g1~~TRINITY_DN10530_c0_g1_i1.p1  ORF type:complete len:1028 (+),score=289.58 TRINITY_DN10530_c0_g1_i1:52-3135(+)
MSLSATKRGLGRQRSKRNRTDVDAIKVAVRVRPFNQREKHGNQVAVVQMPDDKTMTISMEDNETRAFAFDYCYWSHDGYEVDGNGCLKPLPDSKYASQERLFDDLGAPMVQSSLDGFNGCIFCYGQTSAGKSYTMLGDQGNPGLIPRICEQLLAAITASSDTPVEHQLTLSMLEIYNERVYDLLSSSSQLPECRVRQHPKQGFFVEGVAKVPVSAYADIEARMQHGIRLRSTAATNMNKTSSRSHMILTLSLKQIFANAAGESTTKTSDLHLVDLAGSERVATANTEHVRLKEGTAINQSLSTLGNVISALADKASGQASVSVPYRNSVLTKLLSNALGGNSKTVMIANISPSSLNYDESLSTLRFADRAKQIRCRAVVNESPTDKLIRELREENRRLLAQLGADPSNPDAEVLRAGEVELSREVAELEAGWTSRLATEKQRWAAQMSQQGIPSSQLATEPYLSNVNQDPQLTHVVSYVIPEGETMVGKEPTMDQSIRLTGPTIAQDHALFTRQGDKVTVTSRIGASLHVNGKPVTEPQDLRHHDRVVFGPSHMFIFLAAAEQRQAETELHTLDYEFVQLELASEQGMRELLGGRSASTLTLTPETQRLREALLSTVPMIAQANAISAELGMRTHFELFVASNAAHSLTDKSKTVMIQVTNMATRHVWHWPTDFFLARLDMMQELYNARQCGDDETFAAIMADDPFADELEPVFLGSCHVFLQPLAFGIDVDETFALSNYRGVTVGQLAIQLALCDAEGQANRGYDWLSQPDDMLERRVDLLVKVLHACNVAWLDDEPSRGVMVRFRFYTDKKYRETKQIMQRSKPAFRYTKQFTLSKATPSFVNYLQTNALVLELWGINGDGSNESRRDILSPIPASASGQLSPMLTLDQQMDEVVKERHWEEERRQLHDKIHALQQEIDFLQIEKGALAKELTRTATILPDRTLTRVDLATSASADDDLASATSGLLQAQRLLRSFHRQAKGKNAPSDANDRLKALTQAHKQAADRLRELLEASVTAADQLVEEL